MNPETPEPTGIVCLDDTYAYALIGHTVSPTGHPRFCYSLSKLVRRENVPPEEIYKLVQEITADHSDQAPLFVDDEVSQEKVRLLGPTGVVL